MTTFKQFIVEADGEKLAVAMAQKMLSSMVDEVPHIPEQISQGAKHHGHKFVDTVSGPWVVTHYKNGDSEFVKVEPPKGSSKHPMFFLPRGTPNMNEGAVKHAIIDMIDRAIKSTKKNTDYKHTLNAITNKVRELDTHELTAGMSQQAISNMVKPMYDEDEHKDNT